MLCVGINLLFLYDESNHNLSILSHRIENEVRHECFVKSVQTYLEPAFTQKS
jgi:hypothetical protein